MRWSAILLVVTEREVADVFRAPGSERDSKLIEVHSIRAAINATRYVPDAIIASETMPDGDYKDLLDALRYKTSSAPVIITSTDLQEARRVEILEAGAYDCVDLTFGKSEILARVRRTLRRSPTYRVLPDIFEMDKLLVDTNAKQVRAGGYLIPMAAKEYDLLEILILNVDRVISTDFICSRVWRISSDAQIVRHYIKRLRDKLGSPLENQDFIRNLPGVGYQLQRCAAGGLRAGK